MFVCDLFPLMKLAIALIQLLHAHVYILERSQHKVPEEALKVCLYLYIFVLFICVLV